MKQIIAIVKPNVAERVLEGLRREHGAGEVTPWNIGYLVSGDVTAAQDPYFPFSRAVERWRSPGRPVLFS